MTTRPRLQDDLSLLVHVAELYYELKLTQQQVADRLGLSRPAISKLLAQAHEMGIVSIKVRHPLSRAEALASQLKAAYSMLDEVVVVPSSRELELSRLRAATVAAAYFEEHLEDGEVVGIGRGSTIFALVNNLSGRQRLDVKIAPLTGGLGDYDAQFQVSEMARVAATHLGGTCYHLYAPASVGDAATKQALMSDPKVRDTFQLWDGLDWALVGIGAIFQTANPDYLRRVREAEAYSGREVAADLCSRLLDSLGCEIPEPAHHAITVELSQLGQARRVVGVASGATKSRAIAACLAGGWLDILITDEFAAEALLKLVNQPPGGVQLSLVST